MRAPSRVIFCVLTLCVSIQFQTRAQSKPPTAPEKVEADSAKKFLRTAADLKSGASQDVLISFFKLAYQDLQNSHALSFKSNLFALRAKSDPGVWVDNRYKNMAFERNFEFGLIYETNDNMGFKSGTLDLKYALINNRDKDLFKYGPGKLLENFLESATKLAATAYRIYFNKYPDRRSTERGLVRNFYAFTKKEDKTPKAKLPAEYVQILDSLQKQPEFAAVKDVDMDTFRDKLQTMYRTAADLMEKKSLLTLEAKLASDSKNVLSRSFLGLNYLKGITSNTKSSGLEINATANYSFYDSTVVAVALHRQVFNSSLGINWIIYKDPVKQKSYVEFKPSISYLYTAAGLYDGEKRSRLAADGVLRFRITDDIWLPIDIRYDPDKGKWFGLLNVTLNFDALGKY